MTEPAVRARSLAPLAVPAAAAATLAVATVRLRFGIDDAFINFRFAENLAGGLGPVFNAGERVEGYTTSAWVFLLAGLHRLGAPPLRTAHVLGLAPAPATALLAGGAAARPRRPPAGRRGGAAGRLARPPPPRGFPAAP